MAPVLVAGFLVGHALIHASYLAPRPPAKAGGPPWPFELERSWLTRLGISPEMLRPLGLALVGATIGGFALAALAALGFVPASLWVAGVAVGAVASVATLGLFFHPWLTLGFAIDLVLLWAVMVAGWTPRA